MYKSTNKENLKRANIRYEFSRICYSGLATLNVSLLEVAFVGHGVREYLSSCN